MFKKVATLCFVLSMVGVGPLLAQGTGSIAGVARDANAAMSGVKVQLRNVDTGALSGSTQSAANGGFSFSGLPQGNYVIEIVDASGRIIGVSGSMAVAQGAAISGLTVSASAAGSVAAAGASSAFFSSTGGILTLATVGATAYTVNETTQSD